MSFASNAVREDWIEFKATVQPHLPPDFQQPYHRINERARHCRGRENRPPIPQTKPPKAARPAVRGPCCGGLHGGRGLLVYAGAGVGLVEECHPEASWGPYLCFAA